MTAATVRAAVGPDTRREDLDLVATFALALYSLVTALGYVRVFGDWEFLPDAALIVVVGHGLSLLLRRLHVPGPAAVLLTAVAVVWAIAWVASPTTFAAVFPTRETWDIAWADLGLVRSQFREAVAPVEYVGGWSLLAAIGVGFVVLTADTFAFHARARGEALVPGAVLFVFVAAVGANRARVPLTLALVAAGVLAAALLRLRFAQLPRTSLGRPRHPLTVTLPAAALAAGGIVLSAWAIGPRLPGAGAAPLIDTTTGGAGVTEVLSPLVDIRGRLVNRADTELFVVDAAQPAYWRVTGLPRFDGNSWGLPDRSLEEVDGVLSRPVPGSTPNEQRIEVRGLRGRLVPASAEPVQATGEGLRWNAETSTLVRIDRDLEEGDRFSIVSAMPVFTPDVLRAASSLRPPDDIYLELPDNFPSSVTETAQAVTASAPTTYDKMIALQEWFRREFQYSLDVPQGHSTSAIEAFLRQRIGYCEQFAGTFAAMARGLGIPARVAVGYTPGLLQADGSRVVLGKNAHAWPEIWFDELGWVAFEPTPGRGAPGGESYTGVAPAQDDTPPAPGSGAGAGAGGPLPEAPPLIIPDLELDPTGGVPQGPTGPSFRTRVPDRSANWAAIGAVLLGLGLLGAAPELVRRWRRSHPDPDVTRQIGMLWRRALDAVEATGCRVDPTLTPLEQARAIAPRLPVAARPLISLAEATTAATYGTDDEIVHLATPQRSGEPGPHRWCRQVERIAEDSLTAGGRLLRYFTVWR
jgi:transglutaminase-like putative cysteine protease